MQQGNVRRQFGANRRGESQKNVLKIRRYRSARDTIRAACISSQVTGSMSRSWKKMRTNTGEMSTPPMGGITRFTGFMNGLVSELKNGATGWYGFTQESTTWMM